MLTRLFFLIQTGLHRGIIGPIRYLRRRYIVWHGTLGHYADLLVDTRIIDAHTDRQWMQTTGLFDWYDDG